MTWENMTKTQKLIWLKKLSGGGGARLTTVSGKPPLELKNAANRNIKSLIQEGAVEQTGNPNWNNPITLRCNTGRIIPQHGGTSYTDPTVFTTDFDNENISILYNNQILSTATAKTLLTNSKYGTPDTQDIISGKITRRTAVLVLDGYGVYRFGVQNGYRYFIKEGVGGVPSQGAKVCYCTHLPNGGAYTDPLGWIVFRNFCQESAMTQAELQQFIIDQYTNGTPITVIYPLDPTLYYNETVPAQEVTLGEGHNDLLVSSSVYGSKTVQFYQMTGNKTRPIVGMGEVGYAVI